LEELIRRIRRAQRRLAPALYGCCRAAPTFVDASGHVAGTRGRVRADDLAEAVVSAMLEHAVDANGLTVGEAVAFAMGDLGLPLDIRVAEEAVALVEREAGGAG
jgi:hypothetical protein